MKKRLSTLILILVFLIGLSLLLYPAVSSYWNSLRQSRAISKYVEDIESLDQSKLDGILEEAKAYNDGLAKGTPIITKLSDEERRLYNTLLNASGNGIMGYINIPAINCSLPIYHGTDDDVLQIAVGHIEGTSLPTGGASTHCVLSGHRGLPSAELFTNLDKLVVGDTFTINVLNDTLTYEVYDIQTVLPHEIDNLKIERNQDLCTLVTCTPYGVNTHRLFIRAHRIENAEAETTVRVLPEATQIDSIIIAAIVAVPLLVILLLVLLLPKKRK